MVTRATSQRSSPVKNRMREICTSGSVGGEGGNILAYPAPLFANGLAKILPCLKAEIIKRSDQAKGFVKLPKRWIVERTIAWLNRCRRLAKDWENLNRNALAFLKLASIRLMLRKLCNP